MRSYTPNKVVGNETARVQACSSYTLSSSQRNISFIGPYLSVVVGTVNYTYHRFGPLADDAATVYNYTNSLVLISGAGATSAVWQGNFLEELAQDREVITFDPRGFGSRDSVPADSLTIDDIATSLLEFFDALDIDSPDILGWSWGGTIAAYIGAFYGDYISNIVLLDTTSGGEGLTYGAYIQANGLPGLKGGIIGPAAIFPDTKLGNTAMCEFIAYQKIMPGPNVTSAQIIAQSKLIVATYASNELSENLYNISNPTIIFYGKQDVILDVANADYLYNNISLAPDPFLYDESGHALVFQELTNVTSTINEFLDLYDYYDYVLDDYYNEDSKK